MYGNFFIVDNPAFTKSYGVRVIDKGHKVFNNYFEGLLGNKNSLTSLRCPIILYNGITDVNDTTDASKASGYFPAENTIVAFNTIVNCSGGGGIVLGFRNGGSNTFQPQGIVVANNVMKMTTGQAAYNDPANTLLTYFAEGNRYSAPNGAGVSPATGFTNTTLNFGARADGILTAPAVLQDAAINTASYSSLLGGLDVQSQVRSALFDVGADEINGTGPVITYPLDSTKVGAKRGLTITPVQLVSFNVTAAGTSAVLNWVVNSEINTANYIIEHSTNAVQFEAVGFVLPSGSNSSYSFLHKNLQSGKHFYRLKMVDHDGRFQYSAIKPVTIAGLQAFQVYPNPANEFVNARIAGTIKPGTEFRIISPEGKTVKLVKIVAAETRISLMGLSKGMYKIELTGNPENKSTQSLIIQ